MYMEWYLGYCKQPPISICIKFSSKFYRQYDELFHQWFSLWVRLTVPLNLFISNESNDCLRTHTPFSLFPNFRNSEGNLEPFHFKGISSLTCMTSVWFKYSIWTKFKHFKSLLCIELQTEMSSFSFHFHSYGRPLHTGVWCMFVNLDFWRQQTVVWNCPKGFSPKRK